jgi:DNA-binding CsgD family transcriptional regulator
VIATGSIEPADGAPVGNEPDIGWRVWALANNRLYSIAKNAFWRPGENQAECLAGHNQRDVPAPTCHCGFWAMRNPVSAMELAARVECGQRMGSGYTVLNPHRPVAVGLVLGYGAIAVHGGEGYRAGLASVACIFADAPETLETEKANLRRAVADEYGVPCIALDAAISIGFLQEVGVRRQAVEQIRTWIELGRPISGAQPRPISIRPSPPGLENQACELTQPELRIAWLMSQGMTTRQIASSTSLSSRAVEFHMYRLLEKVGVRTRAEVAHWVTKHGG